MATLSIPSAAPSPYDSRGGFQFGAGPSTVGVGHDSKSSSHSLSAFSNMTTTIAPSAVIQRTNRPITKNIATVIHTSKPNSLHAHELAFHCTDPSVLIGDHNHYRVLTADYLMGLTAVNWELFINRHKYKTVEQVMKTFKLAGIIQRIKHGTMHSHNHLRYSAGVMQMFGGPCRVLDYWAPLARKLQSELYLDLQFKTQVDHSRKRARFAVPTEKGYFCFVPVGRQSKPSLDELMLPGDKNTGASIRVGRLMAINGKSTQRAALAAAAVNPRDTTWVNKLAPMKTLNISLECHRI